MATRRLTELIKCSGNAASSGQSFLGHVSGAESGAHATEYELTGWDWTGGPAGADVFPQDSGHTYDMTGSFLGGSRIANIIRQGTGLLAVSNVVVNAGGSVSLDASEVSGSSATASITIVAPYNPGATVSMSGSATYHYDGADHDTPPSSGYSEAHFRAVVTGGGGTSDGDYDNVEFDLSIINVNAGTGAFNDNPTPLHCIAATNHRGIPPADFTVEWHDNSSYTHLVSGAADYFPNESDFAPTSPPNTGYSLWLRYKAPGESTFTNFGVVTFVDSRLSY